MSLWKALPALGIGAALGAAAWFLTREKKEPEHIVGPETEVEPSAAEPAADAPVEEPAPVEAAPETPEQPEAAEPASVNPVELGSEAVPTTEDGKLDVTKIADPADFEDWSETDCKG